LRPPRQRPRGPPELAFLIVNRTERGTENRSGLSVPPFSGMALNRADTLRKDAGWVAGQLQSSSSRALGATHDGVLLDCDIRPQLARRSGEVSALGKPVLLGLDDQGPVFGVDLDGLDPAPRTAFVAGGRIVSLREAGAVLPRAEAGLAAYLVALLNWHRTHGFCSNCGAATVISEAGYSRRCPRCGMVHFPRTDPVVIMIVESAGRLLLGRRAGFPARWYSILAGFVSPGESLEEAVVREVREESGIEAFDPRFVTSQPWPFPSSLMLGFEARSDGGQPVARDGELEDVGWFPLEVVRAAAAERSSELALPPPVSIARFLVERWLARHDGSA
jgi:NAD+ diphosphatase